MFQINQASYNLPQLALNNFSSLNTLGTPNNMNLNQLTMNLANQQPQVNMRNDKQGDLNNNISNNLY